MPELPEVHTIAVDLNKHLSNAVIKSIEIKNNFKTNPPQKDFIKSLINKKIIKVTRISKNIVLELSSETFLIFHLAMTGRLLIRKSDRPNDDWERIILTLAKNGKTGQLRFCDTRMFGKAEVIKKEMINKLKSKYGPDILADSLSPEEFLSVLVAKRTNIKNALLDQSVVSGIGNIYANDLLWMSKTHPLTKTNSIKIAKAKELLNNAKEIIKEAILHRGSTLSDKMFVDAFGKYGTHQNYFRVYDQRNCKNCGTKIKFEKINSRGTYYCPTCQVLKQ